MANIGIRVPLEEMGRLMGICPNTNRAGERRGTYVIEISGERGLASRGIAYI